VGAIAALDALTVKGTVIGTGTVGAATTVVGEDGVAAGSLTATGLTGTDLAVYGTAGFGTGSVALGGTANIGGASTAGVLTAGPVTANVFNLNKGSATVSSLGGVGTAPVATLASGTVMTFTVSSMTGWKDINLNTGVDLHGGAMSATGQINVGGGASVKAGPTQANQFNLTSGTARLSSLAGVGTTPSATVAASQTLTVDAGVTAMDSISLAGTLVTSNTTRSTDVTNLLSITGSGTLDLKDGFLVVDYTPGGSPLADVRQWIVNGRHGGDWLGTGITSSIAAANKNLYAVGYIDNALLPTAQRYTTFGGVSVDPTSILVRYTWAADLNLDGLISDADVTVQSALYDNGLTTGHYWWQGDLNGDGKITDADVTVLSALYPRGAVGDGAPVGLGPVPEPATLALLAVGGLLALAGRRRRRHG
jgi:hypothetical protein